jgi:hypothetical protein
VWHYLFLYWTLELFREWGIICFFYWTLEMFRQFDIICFSTGLWNFFESVAILDFHFCVPLFVFLLEFGTVPTVWHYLFSYLYWMLELFRPCSVICFYMGRWNCADNVALFVFIWDFGTVTTVWHHLFIYWTLEMFRQCNIFLFFYVTLELFRQYGIICFSMWLWNCSSNKAIFVSLLDFRTVPTMWHHLFFDRTLELFRQCEMFFLMDIGTVLTVWHYLFFYRIFGTVPRVWHHLLFNWTLELFRQCAIIGFSFFYWTLKLFR